MADKAVAQFGQPIEFGSGLRSSQRLLIGWFGVRGVGSIYYLSLALNHGLPHGTAQLLIGVTLVTITASVLVHGVSVTPLLTRYRKGAEGMNESMTAAA